MGRAEVWSNARQRMVTNGDLILVHQLPRPAPAPVAPEPAPAVWPAAVRSAPVPHAPAAPSEPPSGQAGAAGYTPAPPGYAYEFGTGRLVPIRRGLIPGV